jgi:uncharacterized protein (TIGR03503 family)
MHSLAHSVAFLPARNPILYILTLLLAFASFQTMSAPADIRVLIDISGSMKKNDPNNLRVPAVNLLTELIPDGDQAGVWTFGQYVNMLIKHQKVDSAWRKNARQKAKEINSVALYTNIGGVLEKSSDDFSKGADFKNTHFILLTDGMVDIDKDPAKNLSERERVLTDIAKRFKEKGAKIHTIALSKNADMSLLEKMSVDTGGVAAVAETPEDLTRIFVRALDQAAPAAQVPLEGNSFDIDSSVEELTALIFRKKGSKATQLVEPNDQRYSYGNQPDYVSWFQDAGYDLITVRQPFEGTWKIDAELMPDSRVTVVSNLKMTVAPLPANFFAGDLLNVEAVFEEDGKPLTNPDFLRLLDVDLNIKTADGKSGTKRLSDSSAPPVDGKYRDTISKLKDIGQYEVNVLVDGKTFKRKNRQIINLRSPLDVELAKVEQAGQSFYNLVITPLSESIDLEKTTIVAKIKAPDGSNVIKTIPLNKEKGRWELAVEPGKGDGTYQVDMKVKGVTKEGNAFQFAPRKFEAVFPMELGGAQFVPIPEPAADETAATEVEESAPEEVEPEAIIAPIEIPAQLEQPAEVAAAVDPEVAKEDAEPFAMNLWAIIGAAVGSVVLLGGGFGFWLFKKRSGASAPAKPASSKSKSKVKDDDEEDDDQSVDIFNEPEFDEPELEEPPKEKSKPKPVIVDDEIEDELDFVEEPDDIGMSAPAADETDELEQMVAEAAFDSDSLSESVPELEPEPVEEDIPVIEDEVEADEIEPEVDVDSLIAEMGMGSDNENVVDGKSAEEIADEILAENEPTDDEEFNLEDFDISETDGLPDEDDKK